MFALLGTAEVILLLIAGAFLGPMFMRPMRRGGPLLYGREFDVNRDRWPTVRIIADHAGAAPWLLRLIGHGPRSSLELGATMLVSQIEGVFQSPGAEPIELAGIRSATAKRWHPMYHIPAMFMAGFPMLASGLQGRLSLAGFGKGVVLVALICLLATVQSTIDLVITVDGRRKPIVYAFSVLGRNQPSLEQLCEACDRIMEMAIAARARRRAMPESASPETTSPPARRRWLRRWA